MSEADDFFTIDVSYTKNHTEEEILFIIQEVTREEFGDSYTVEKSPNQHLVDAITFIVRKKG